MVITYMIYEDIYNLIFQTLKLMTIGQEQNSASIIPTVKAIAMLSIAQYKIAENEWRQD